MKSEKNVKSVENGNNREKLINMPTKKQLEEELRREKYKIRYKKLLRSTIYVLIIVSAVSILVATLLLPVLQIYGTSMTPTLTEGDIVVSVKGNNFNRGDVIAFYYNNKVLVKRVIAASSEWVEIDETGRIYVNNALIEEPYIQDYNYGECDITFPYQVPENSYFVVGDLRETSLDSRNSVIGCIDKGDVVGKIVFKVWPLKHFGNVK